MAVMIFLAGVVIAVAVVLIGFMFMASVADLTNLVAKIAADIDSHLEMDKAKDAKLAEQEAKIGDLQTQLDAFKNDQAAIDSAVSILTAADAKLV